LPGAGFCPMVPSFMASVERDTRSVGLYINHRLLPTSVSAVSNKIHNMSDIDPSGAATTAAETASAPSAPPQPAPTLGTFSNNRGSGLARGKRPASPAPQTTSAAPAVDYKPTAVSILTAPTEYKNPFAPPAPQEPVVSPEVSTPAPVAPAPLPATPAAGIPAPQVEAPVAVPTGAAAPAPVPGVPTTPAQMPAADAEAVAPKPELKILPPETPRRVEQSWESKSFSDVAGQPGNETARPEEGRSAGPRPYREDRRGDRPYYRSDRERRDNRPGEFSEQRQGSEAPDRSQDRDRGRGSPAPAPASVEPKKSGGLFGWVRKLFGSAPAEAPKPEAKPEVRGERERERNQEGPYRRRRHRGGRGRNFQGDQRGPRDGQSGGQPSGDQRGYGGDQRGYGGDNRPQGHRRHNRHGGGGFRGNGRPEGGPPPSGS
jgi:hypothetical protein